MAIVISVSPPTMIYFNVTGQTVIFPASTAHSKISGCTFAAFSLADYTGTLKYRISHRVSQEAEKFKPAK
jgi:hypothetical protein